MTKRLELSGPVGSEAVLISELVASVLGERTIKVAPVKLSGSINSVFDVQTDRARLIVRMNTATYGVHLYHKEKWAMAKARQKGVPVPSVLAICQTESHVYMICTHVPGVTGIEYGGDTTGIWRQLGRYSRIINSIDAQGFGGIMAQPYCGRFAQSWEEWVTEELAKLFKDDVFVREGILSNRQVGKAREILESLFGWSFSPTLSHGNLSLENSIIGEDATVTVIDWGNAVSHRSPHFDLAEVCAWNKNPAVAAAFSQGYGISRHEFERMSAETEVLQLWRILDCVRWNLKRQDSENGRKFVEYGVKKLRTLLPVGL